MKKTEVRCASVSREKIIQILCAETGEISIYHPSPTFTVSIGSISLMRDGRIIAEPDAVTDTILSNLVSLGLCTYSDERRNNSSFTSTAASATDSPPGSRSDLSGSPFTYPMQPHTGRSLLNLISIFSARQSLINQAISAEKAFRITPPLIETLLHHPPTTINEFRQVIDMRQNEHRGICFDQTTLSLIGFLKAPEEEQHLCKQLADHIIQSALQSRWVKPFIPNKRNRRYAFRTWLYAIGMKGPEYEQLRNVMLGRLYGKSDRRPICGRKPPHNAE